MKPKKIVIAGAGVNGVSLALALKFGGVKACVYEQSPVPRVAGTGIYIWPQGMTILRRLLDKKQLEAIAKPINYLNTRDKQGQLIHAQALKQCLNGREETAYMFHRERLYKLLLAGLEKDQLHFNKKLINVRNNDENVSLLFSNGDKICADYLVGADGIYSSTKRVIFPELKSVDSKVSVRRGVVNFALSAQQDQSCDIYAGKNARIVTYPTYPGSNERYWFAAYYNDTEEFLDKDALLDQFSDYSPELLSMIEATDNNNVIDSHLHDLPVGKRWSRSRVVLLGDAAHAVLPTVGYGFSLGLENAYTLARSLLKRPDQIAEGFSVYEKSAMERTKIISEVSREFTDLFYKTSESASYSNLKLLYQKLFSTISYLPYETV